MTYREMADKIEAMNCPSCGRETLRWWEDTNGCGGQCGSLDCLEIYEADELLEPHE